MSDNSKRITVRGNVISDPEAAEWLTQEIRAAINRHDALRGAAQPHDDRDNGVRFFQGIINSIWITASLAALGWMIWRIFS